MSLITPSPELVVSLGITQVNNSLREFESLGLPVKPGLNYKQQLFKRLSPELLALVVLHPGEPRATTAFSADVCALEPPRTQTEPVEIGGSTYQLRHFHYWGACKGGACKGTQLFFRKAVNACNSSEEESA